MATVSSSTSAANASSELQRIEREVKRIQQQLAQKNSGKEVQEFQKDTRDVKFDSNATARDIGQLKQNETRLNLFSSLSNGDSVDIYRFKVTSTAETTFSILNATQEDEDKLRFQILNKATGRVVADSNAKAGEAHTDFEALRDGKFQLPQGDYLLRVSRAQDVGEARKTEYSYAIRCTRACIPRITTRSSARRAPPTIRTAARRSARRPPPSPPRSPAASASCRACPRSARSATDKLMGLIINSVS